MENIGKQLYIATVGGDTESLIHLLEQDEFLLNRYGSFSGFCCNETPLHVAATRGYVDYAKVLLQHKPCLVTELDFMLRSPLHMACANGQVEMVDLLLDANADLCLMEDQFGRIPLHIAAMAMGNVHVVNKLVVAKPETIMYPLNRIKTVMILHSYVIRNGRESLEQLVEVDHTFLNSQDGEGNTILHKVVSLKKLEILEYLVTRTQMVVNVKNQNNFTPLDIIEKIPEDSNTTKMKQLLLGINMDTISTEEKTRMNAMDTWLEKRRNGLLISATVIASMAFQAGLNPPGGVWGDDNDNYPLHDELNVTVIAGTSIMSVNSPDEYIQFLKFNTISFVAALSIVLLLISSPPRFRWSGASMHKAYMWLLTTVVWLTATMTTLTYRAVTYAISPWPFDGLETQFDHANSTTKWILYSWIIFICCLFLVNTCPVLYSFSKKICKSRNKGTQQNHSNVAITTSSVV